MDVIMNDKTTELIINICKMALNGTIDIKEYYNIWPEDTNNDPFYEIVYDDIENGIEHIPGYFFKQGVNIDQWINSMHYLTIYLDVKLLMTNQPSAALVNYRKFIVQNTLFSTEQIDEEVSNIQHE